MLLLLFLCRFNFWFILTGYFTFNFEIDRVNYLILLPLRLITWQMLLLIMYSFFLFLTLSFTSVHAKSCLFLQTIHSCQDKVQFSSTIKINLSWIRFAFYNEIWFITTSIGKYRLQHLLEIRHLFSWLSIITKTIHWSLQQKDLINSLKISLLIYNFSWNIV